MIAMDGAKKTRHSGGLVLIVRLLLPAAAPRQSQRRKGEGDERD